MSRTFRRKGFEKTQPNRPFNKTAGYYTQHDYVDYQWVYRPPTKEEYWHDWKYNHCESRSGRFGPTKKYKRQVNSEDRMSYQKQFNRWLSNPEFEIIDQRVATSAKWDWS